MTVSRRILLVTSFGAAAVSLVAGWSADGEAWHRPQARVVSSDLSLPAPITVGWPDPTILNPTSVGPTRGQVLPGFSIKPTRGPTRASRGRYVFHCNNLEHEDMARMANFEMT
jgi:spore coat protein A, manganese oxidase